MIVRINVATENGAQTFVVDIACIKDRDLLDAINKVLAAPEVVGNNGTYGRYEVINGSILQQGYECNEELIGLDIPDGIPVININTD